MEQTASGKDLIAAVGLMSGTSMDGVDAAFIETDGQGRVQRQHFVCLPYEEDLKEDLRACLGKTKKDAETAKAEAYMTKMHIEAVQALYKKAKRRADIIGFHGHTITHKPEEHFTWQLGNPSWLAKETDTDVVFDLRKADIEAGGQGAPLLPLYHQALAKDLPRPCAVLNIGGVSNITCLGSRDTDIVSFDTGPGNALMDDFILQKTGKTYDAEGALASSGKIHEDIVSAWLNHPYFMQAAPKSLDRNAWDISSLEGVSVEDGLATLCAFTVRSIAISLAQCPEKPKSLYVSGGGRKNQTLMAELQKSLGISVWPVETLGWNGDALEAEGFAYLAVRSLLGLALTVPETTGVKTPMTGGVLHQSAA